MTSPLLTALTLAATNGAALAATAAVEGTALAVTAPAEGAALTVTASAEGANRTSIDGNNLSLLLLLQMMFVFHMDTF